MKKQKIIFVVCEKMLSTSLSLPVEMLRAAEATAQGKGKRDISLDIRTLGLSDQAITTLSGLNIQPDYALSDLDPTSAIPCDQIYLPALWRNPKKIIRQAPELLTWLRQQYEAGATISAVGTGCCFMAEAGLLDGKAATTHWHYFDQFQRDYPKVQLKRQYFITQAGNLYCTASVNALAELTVHFIQRLFGRPIARNVERNFFHEIRSAFESNSFGDSSGSHPDEDIVQVQIWLEDNLCRSITLPEVASQFGMSVRSLNRRFKAATNQTPLQFLQEKRLDSAKDLLQTSNLSIAEIAFRVGYQDVSHFTQRFKALMATTPSDYRGTVRAKLFSH